MKLKKGVVGYVFAAILAFSFCMFLSLANAKPPSPGTSPTLGPRPSPGTPVVHIPPHHPFPFLRWKVDFVKNYQFNIGGALAAPKKLVIDLGVPNDLPPVYLDMLQQSAFYYYVDRKLYNPNDNSLSDVSNYPFAYYRSSTGNPATDPSDIAADQNYIYIADFGMHQLYFFDKATGKPATPISSLAGLIEPYVAAAISGTGNNKNLYVITKEDSNYYLKKYMLYKNADTASMAADNMETYMGQLALGASKPNFPVSLNSPSGIAVDQEIVYVLEKDRIMKIEDFTKGPAYISNPNMPFNNPSDIAVDPITRNVFVADTGFQRIQMFDKDGKFVTSWGGAGVAQNDPLYMETPASIVAYGNLVFVGDASTVVRIPEIKLFKLTPPALPQ